MVAYTVNPAAVGTSLVAGPSTISGATVAALPSGVDPTVPVTLVDAANATAAANGAHTLFSSYIADLAYLFEPRPGYAPTGGPAPTPPTYPRSLWGSIATIAFANGIFVKSCPSGLTITVDAP